MKEYDCARKKMFKTYYKPQKNNASEPETSHKSEMKMFFS